MSNDSLTPPTSPSTNTNSPLETIARVIAILALVLAVWGAKTAINYGTFNDAWRSSSHDNPQHDTLGSIRHELRGRAQGLALGTIAATVAAFVLAFISRRKTNVWPTAALAPAALATVGAIVILAHDVF